MESRKHPSRPYRSKRHPPCVQCRRKKLRCDSKGNICQRCETTGLNCSFAAVRTLPDAEVAPIESRIPENEASQFQAGSPFTALDTSIVPNLAEESISDFLLPSHPAYDFPERPTPQVIQTLDGLRGFSSQVIGASGESDPWLLRHGKFNDHGFLPFRMVHVRNSGGVPVEEKIPVHFLVTADQCYELAKAETRFPRDGCVRDHLNALVPLECGQRLVSLYVDASRVFNI